MERRILEGWSSMPSDHAVLFFAIAAGLFLISRPIGILAFLHAIFVVSAPRVYLGMLYPSDILVGALVGVAVTYVIVPAMASWRRGPVALERYMSYPHLFYPFMFFATFQIASMFITLRWFLVTVFAVTKMALA